VISLFLIGILGCVKSDSPSIPYAQAGLALSWLAIYSMSVGPIVYTIVAEVGATRLRTQTVVLGRGSYYVANLIGGVIEPYMINPTQWNLKGRTAFLVRCLLIPGTEVYLMDSLTDMLAVVRFECSDIPLGLFVSRHIAMVYLLSC